MPFAKKHKTLFYVPGMISLVLIPVWCLWFIHSNRYFQRDYSVSFSIVDSIQTGAEENGLYFPGNSFRLKRDFKTISFNGKNDELKLKALNVSLKKMVADCDSINGFKFHFGKHCSYQTFISAQDLLFINKVDFYTAYKNDIYACAIPRKKSKSTISGEIGNLCYVGTPEYWEKLERAEQRKLFIQNIKRFWQVPFGLGQ